MALVGGLLVFPQRHEVKDGRVSGADELRPYRMLFVL